MNRMTDTSVVGTKLASYSLMATLMTGLAWMGTDSPVFGALAVILGLVSISALVSIPAAVLWKGSAVSNEFPSASGA